MEACTNPDVLKVIYFIWEILKILFIVVPIGLIIMIGVDFFKNVTASKDDNMKKNLQLVIKRLIYCVAMFFVPTIINIVNYVVGVALEDTKINYTECLTNANSETINSLIDSQAQTAYEKALNEKTMASILEAEEAINKKSDDSTKESMLKELSTLKEEILSGKKQEQSDIDKANNSSNGGTSSGGTSQGNGKTTGTLTSPIDPKDTNKDMIGRMNMSSRTLYYNNGNYHGGSDVPVSTGTKIYAMDGGTVQTAAYKTGVGGANPKGYGNYVIIKHVIDGKPFYTIYAHLSKVNVKANDSVSQGQLIGESGNTGNSTGPHLHMELVTDISVLGHTANCVHILTLDYIGTGKSYKDASGYCHE